MAAMVFSMDEAANKVLVCAGVPEKGDKCKQLKVLEWLVATLKPLKGKGGGGKGGLAQGQGTDTSHVEDAMEVAIKNKEVPATRSQVWIAAYTTDGMPGSSAAAELMNQMNELSTQMEGSSTQPADKDEEIFARVMGPERPGRVRIFGLGPSLTDVFGGGYQNRLNQTQLQEQLQAYQVQMEAKVKEMMEAMRTELQSTIQAQQAKMEHLKSMFLTMGGAANGQVPDAASTHRTSASGQPVSLHHQSHAFTSSYAHRP